MSDEEKSNSKKRKADSVDENRLNYQKQRCEELKEQLKRLENGRFFVSLTLSLSYGHLSRTMNDTENKTESDGDFLDQCKNLIRNLRMILQKLTCSEDNTSRLRTRCTIST